MSHSSTANTLRAMVKQAAQAADILDKLGSIEQATGEAVDRQSRVEKEVADTEVRLQTAKDALAWQEKINADNLQKARGEAAAIVNKAGETLQAADAYFAEKRAQIENELVAHRDAKASADSELSAILKRSNSAQAELDAINKKLDAARAAFKAALA